MDKRNDFSELALKNLAVLIAAEVRAKEEKEDEGL